MTAAEACGSLGRRNVLGRSNLNEVVSHRRPTSVYHAPSGTCGLFMAFAAETFSHEECSAVCFTTMCDTSNRDTPGTIIDHVEYPVVTGTLPPLILKPDKLLRTVGAWILRQTANS